MKPNLSNHIFSKPIGDHGFQSGSKIRLFLIPIVLCALFFFLVQPNFLQFLLNSSPMLWECM